MAASGDIQEILRQSGLFLRLFDIVRIVDPKAGKLLELENGRTVETPVDCVTDFGVLERCKNCTSIRAIYSNEEMVKLEYANDCIYLVISAPLLIDEKPAVAELVKDITRSMTVDVKDEYRNGEVVCIIDKFNKMAVTDELTGLMNRRYIDEKLPNILLKSAEINEPVSVAMLDIDFFKKFNDTYGHQTGDVVLSETAKILMSFIRRNSDFAARYGGEEFLLCFPGVPLETCRSICERVRQRFENHVFKHDATELSITVSIGVASSVELENASQESIIELSDKRLYGAKSTGRNKVI